METWTKRPVEHIENGEVRISVVFTWDLPAVYQRAAFFRAEGYRVVVGGPAVRLMPDYLADVAEVGGDWPDAVSHHNPRATFTSRGCIRRCPFCAVWRTEGMLRELDEWPVRPIVCDNNLLACSRKHFDRVVDRLKPLSGVDFNQGLDARLLTKYHADRLAELDCLVRLAWDHIDTGNQFMTAYELLRKAKIPKKRIRVYVLVGYSDTPLDALFRLRTVANMGIDPNPMRYNPLDSMKRDSYVAPNWSSALLRHYLRYWSNLRRFRAIPFDEYLETYLQDQ